MPEFRPISLADKPLFDAALAAEHTRNSTLSFGNVYLWSLLCRRNVAELDGRLGIEFLCSSGDPFFVFPAGSGPLAPAVEALSERARSKGRPLELRGLTAAERDALEAACPGRFLFERDADNDDYVYSAEALSTLRGKKLHAKRNFCNRFELAHRWRSEKLTAALFPDVLALLDRWDAERGGGSDDENQAIRSALSHWNALDMQGCVLYAEDAPAAFSFGEYLSPDTFDTHFEKAEESIPGAYPMVCRELVRQLMAENAGLLYINREEDMGIPGLRRAKQEWFPLFMLEKYTAREREA